MWMRLDEFLWLVTSYRVINIRGHFGSGKTLLAVALAYELWKRHYSERIFTNFPMQGRCEDYDTADRTNFCMIIDEPQEILDSRDYARNETRSWLKSLRKRKIILLLPGVLAIDVRFRSVMAQRILQLGNLLWVYRWQVDDGAGVHTNWFGMWRPSRYFGAYSTRYEPADEDFANLRKLMGEDDNNEKAGVAVVERVAPTFVVDPANESPRFKKQVEVPRIQFR